MYRKEPERTHISSRDSIYMHSDRKFLALIYSPASFVETRIFLLTYQFKRLTRWLRECFSSRELRVDSAASLSGFENLG
ncbi:hypothetical protein B0O99DRAFT_615285, partial [Bisporella sp. PMI_857]